MITKRADEVVTGDVLADGSRVTGAWRMYLVGTGYGSIAVDGKRRKVFCAEAVEVERETNA